MRIIAGMHRTGTSLVARLFHEMGADLGDPETFYRPDRWNPDGYYEQPDIHAVNMPLIHGLFGRFAYFRLPSEATVRRRGRRMAREIQQTASRYEGKVVKENRFCLTLGAWLEQGASVERIVVCLREPAHVVQSLKRRNTISHRLAYSLWLAHYQRLLDTIGDIPRWFVDYANLLDPERFMEEMEPALRFMKVEGDSEKLADLRKTQVKPQMSHGRDGPNAYPEQVETLWNELRDRHQVQFLGCSGVNLSRPFHKFALGVSI